MEGGALSYAGADPAGRVQFPTSICSSLRAIVGIRDPGTMLGVRGAAMGAVIASNPVTSSRFWAPRPKRSAGRHAAVYRVGCLVRRARFGCTEPNCRLGRTRKTMLPSRLWSDLRRFAEVELV